MFKTLALATALAGTLLCAGKATAQNADVMHWWTSGGESRAIAVFAKEYDKRGGKWIDDASVGPQAEHAAALNRIAGGNPPTAMQWNIGVAGASWRNRPCWRRSTTLPRRATGCPIWRRCWSRT